VTVVPAREPHRWWVRHYPEQWCFRPEYPSQFDARACARSMIEQVRNAHIDCHCLYCGPAGYGPLAIQRMLRELRIE
jgi:hypothetical protein